MEKRIPSQTGEFAKIHLVHGLYRQLLWDVGQSLERPLSRWTPVAERIDSSTMTPDVWLPRIPKYEKWRNASCDVIDVRIFSSPLDYLGSLLLQSMSLTSVSYIGFALES